MDVNQLKYFISIARHENMTRAAESLFISQPSLSTSMKRLEDELGTKLFERHHYSLKLTTAGEIFIKHAEKALLEIETARARIEYSQQSRLNKVMLAIHPMLSQNQMVADAVKQFPETVLQFVTMSPVTMKERDKDNLIDLFISIDTKNPDKEYYHLCDEKLILLVPEDNPLAKYDSVPLATLKNESWALYPQGTARFSHIANSCLQEGFFPKVSFESTSILGLCSAIKLGKFITLLPQSSIPELDISGLKTLEISVPECMFSFYLGWNKDREIPEHVEHVKQFIIRHFQNNPVIINITN